MKGAIVVNDCSVRPTVPRNQIIEGSALDVLRTLPDETIDLVVTSPPYWGLRTYGTRPQIWGGAKDCRHDWCADLKIWHSDRGDGPRKEIFDDSFQSEGTESCTCRTCNAWRGELGLEPYFYQYIEHLCQIFDEVKRVLKLGGTLWVNLGDTYWGGGNASGHSQNTTQFGTVPTVSRGYVTKPVARGAGYPSKSLCQIPNRFAIEMINRGWILRNELIWWKPNCMPSSVKDRFTVDFEKIFFFTKSKEYFFETQREPWTDGRPADIARAIHGHRQYGGKWNPRVGGALKEAKIVGHPRLGRNKRAVWRIATKAFRGAHFAVFPPELVETPVKAGCPEFVCRKCAKPREKIYESVDVGRVQSNTKYNAKIDTAGRLAEERQAYRALGFENPPPPRFVSYTDCGCGAGFEPGIVLDPFMGSGTTALVALKLNRSFIGIELNPEYVAMASGRVQECLEKTR